jgi:hypothetical protein
MRYKARADWLVKVSMLVGIVAPAVIAVLLNLPWMSAASVFAAVLVFGISFPQWYETKPNALIIRSGLTTRLIEYSRLVAVRPSADNRISLDYGIGNVLIAPQNTKAFMDDVAAHAPHLSKQGQELVATLD